MIYRVNRYDIKGKEILKTQEKYYAIDIGLRYHMLGQSANRDMEHILENIVYLELLRRKYKVYIGKIDDLEVDFVAQNSEDTIYYQLSLTTREENTLQRKINTIKENKRQLPKIYINNG